MKKWITIIALGHMLLIGLFAAFSMNSLPKTYDGSKANVTVYELQQNPESYDDSFADGAAAVIVQQNLATTHAVNDVTSIVFDFRGYDTMGEAFVLLLTISGVIVLLEKTKAEKEQMRLEREAKKHETE